jgi:uncharacterized membrane protein YhiD involved in acid resistance
MLHDLNTYIVGRLLLAALLGGIVGLERELSHKPAGIRTNMLICLGASLFTIISYEMAGNVGGDHTRIAAQIIPGIGFLGAGVVLRERGAIIGITSAATIFVVASIGMSVGAGLRNRHIHHAVAARLAGRHRKSRTAFRPAESHRELSHNGARWQRHLKAPAPDGR